MLRELQLLSNSFQPESAQSSSTLGSHNDSQPNLKDVYLRDPNDPEYSLHLKGVERKLAHVDLPNKSAEEEEHSVQSGLSYLRAVLQDSQAARKSSASRGTTSMPLGGDTRRPSVQSDLSHHRHAVFQDSQAARTSSASRGTTSMPLGGDTRRPSVQSDLSHHRHAVFQDSQAARTSSASRGTTSMPLGGDARRPSVQSDLSHHRHAVFQDSQAAPTSSASRGTTSMPLGGDTRRPSVQSDLSHHRHAVFQDSQAARTSSASRGTTSMPVGGDARRPSVQSDLSHHSHAVFQDSQAAPTSSASRGTTSMPLGGDTRRPSVRNDTSSLGPPRSHRHAVFGPKELATLGASLDSAEGLPSKTVGQESSESDVDVQQILKDLRDNESSLAFGFASLKNGSFMTGQLSATCHVKHLKHFLC